MEIQGINDVHTGRILGILRQPNLEKEEDEDDTRKGRAREPSLDFPQQNYSKFDLLLLPCCFLYYNK